MAARALGDWARYLGLLGIATRGVCVSEHPQRMAFAAAGVRR